MSRDGELYLCRIANVNMSCKGKKKQMIERRGRGEEEET
jgi:hypothetical protein